jgi:hypothetical protein
MVQTRDLRVALYGLHYLEGRDDPDTRELKRFVEHDLHYEDYNATLLWYETIGKCEFFDDNAGVLTQAIERPSPSLAWIRAAIRRDDRDETGPGRRSTNSLAWLPSLLIDT